jgi:hypothetical protein
MGDSVERRVARNEDLFRETNEAIAKGLWPGEPRGPVRFRCECARIDCNAAVEVPLSRYEETRRHPERFIVVAGHQLPEFERVVGEGDGYLIVQKIGVAGEEARELAPRQ